MNPGFARRRGGNRDCEHGRHEDRGAEHQRRGKLGASHSSEHANRGQEQRRRASQGAEYQQTESQSAEHRQNADPDASRSLGAEADERSLHDEADTGPRRTERKSPVAELGDGAVLGAQGGVASGEQGAAALDAQGETASGAQDARPRLAQVQTGRAAPGTKPGLAQALAGEFKKLAGVPSTWLTCALTAALAALMAGSLAPRPEQAGQAVRSVADVAAAGFIVLGVLASTGEYSGGQMFRSLLCCPRRGRLLAAKAASTVCWAAALAATTMLACAWAAGLPASGWRLGVAGGVHLTALAAIAAAVGLVLRGLVASLGTALVCLVVAPPLLRWSALPTSIGQKVMDAALNGGDGSAPALAALAAWALAAWAVAAARLTRGDA